MHARKRKVLAERLLFLLWPVIHYWTWKINKRAVLLSSGGGGGNIEKLISGGDVYLAPKSSVFPKGTKWKHEPKAEGGGGEGGEGTKCEES